jgi:hexosaminidase
MRKRFCLLINLLVLSSLSNAAQEQDLRLVPFPKETGLEPGSFSLQSSLILEVPAGQKETFGRVLNDELKRAGLQEARVRDIDSADPAFRLASTKGPGVLPALPKGKGPVSYSLEVRAQEVVCNANDATGLFYGLQTLCQLIRANLRDGTLPCLRIRDWPSLRWRCFQDDMTRGPSSTLDTLKFEASLAAQFKLNLMTYYMEYQYIFKKHPAIGPTNGSLTAKELAELVTYAKPLHLDILGNQQSFGHLGAILRHPEYAGLRETPEVVSPVREGTYQLLEDFYSEVCPSLPFPWFNVCCDETEGLGQGPSKELAARIGVGGVYVSHINRIHDLLRDKHNKRMMMWGDIILQHPDNLTNIPKDTIMLTWGYDARANFENQIIPFAKSGYEFFVCPGVSDWSRILPDFGVAVTNIQNFVRDGVKHGAIGMINTDWEDDGEALKAVKWHADAWAAECAWNASVTPPEVFNRRIGAVLFGETDEHFGQAIELLAQAHRLPPMKGMFNARFWEKDFVPKASPAAIQATGSNLLAIVRPALAHLEACRRDAKCNQRVLEVFQFGARRMELIGQRMLDGLAAAQLYEQAVAGAGGQERLGKVEALVRKNRDAHELIGRQFAELWMSESKPYALDWTLRRYTNAVGDYDTLLRKVETARAAAAEGKALPAPDEVGLAMPEPVFRRVQPKETVSAPLAPDLPWTEVSASHRIGLIIRAGTVDRFDLPVEVDLRLPAALTGKPVRAFLLSSNGTPREVLAQVDRLGQSGKVRLVLVLDGSFLRETEASVHVYLGLTQAPSPLPGAVSTTTGTHDMRWIENDRVRLLLGPEGAHVYRWEVKAAGSRDLTMPGETDWAGFSDVNPRRHSQYTLNCKARGPALVEYEASDNWGDTKTIRLYSAASWIEVLLSEPTPVYWDFDDPKTFAADGPTPGTWLFSDGKSGPVGREADGVPAQVKAPNTLWGMKYNADKLAVGLATPGVAGLHVIAPGAGAGGAGIENSPPVRHFVTFSGMLTASAAETMNRLQTTLDLKRPVEVRLFSIQTR